jgi:hypothetical protein
MYCTVKSDLDYWRDVLRTNNKQKDIKGVYPFIRRDGGELGGESSLEKKEFVVKKNKCQSILVRILYYNNRPFIA